MDFVFIQVFVVEVLKQEVTGIGIRDVHRFLEDVAKATSEQSAPAYLLTGNVGLLKGLDVGKPATVVTSAQADGYPC